MTTKLKPRPFRLLDSCTKTCSLNAHQLGASVAELVHGWFEQGCNNATIHERAAQIGKSISEGAAGRHRANHLEPLNEEDGVDPTDVPSVKVDDIELLDMLIARGAEGLRFKTAKVSTEQLLKAMDLKYKLTQGSVWEATLAALGGAMEGANDEPDVPEDTPALASADELAQALE